MKKLFLITLLFCFASSFSQNKQTTWIYNKAANAIEHVYMDGTKVVEKAYEAAVSVTPKIEKALESLGTSLKVGADRVWALLVKQQLVWSICFLILTISALVNWLLFCRTHLNKSKLIPTPCTTTYHPDRYSGVKTVEETTKYISTSPVVVMFFHLASCIILSCFSFYHFTDMLTGFINPEFGAMKTIVEIAGQIR